MFPRNRNRGVQCRICKLDDDHYSRRKGKEGRERSRPRRNIQRTNLSHSHSQSQTMQNRRSGSAGTRHATVHCRAITLGKVARLLCSQVACSLIHGTFSLGQGEDWSKRSPYVAVRGGLGSGITHPWSSLRLSL